MRILRPQALTAEAFRPFGEVIELGDARRIPVNEGSATRFHDLANVDVLASEGRPLISVFRAEARSEPVRLSVMERHPLGSQAFVPLGTAPFLVVVAADDGGKPGELQAFITRGWQGVNYAKGVWHHPLLALLRMSDFLVVDRGGPGVNLEEHVLADAICIDLS